MSILFARSTVLRPNELELETKGRTHIPNELAPERPPVAMAAARDLLLPQHPSAEVRSLSATYNCIGMVVASRRTTVLPAQLVETLMRDGYRRIPEAEVVRGDVVVYRCVKGEVTHAGIVIGKKVVVAGGAQDAFRVVSQWGRDGEYEHDSCDVPPVYGSPVEFWSDRRVV